MCVCVCVCLCVLCEPFEHSSLHRVVPGARVLRCRLRCRSSFVSIVYGNPQTHGGVSLRTPGALLTFGDIAASGPDVLLARRGSGLKLPSVDRATEQAEVLISSRRGNAVVPLSS